MRVGFLAWLRRTAARTESSFGVPVTLRSPPGAGTAACHRPRCLLGAVASPRACTSGKKKEKKTPKPRTNQQTCQKKETWLLFCAAKERCEPAESLFVFCKLFASWLWHRLRTSFANICTNFMLIKIRLLRQAWLLSHSYYYCLDLWYYKRKGKACSRRVMVVNFSREGFSLQFFSINDCCMNGLQGLLEDSVDPLGNPSCNTYAGFFPLCSSDLKNYLIFLGCFSPLKSPLK